MKPHDPTISTKRLAVCATTLAFLVGALAASAQSGSSSSSGTRSSTGSSMNSTGSSMNNSSTNSSSRDQTGSSTSTGGNYNSSTRSGSTGSMAGSTATSGDKDKLSWGDKRFVTKAADHGQSEVALAQLAAQQASNPEVRRYAQRLVNDHTRVNSELMSIASTKNVKLDKEEAQDRTYRRLSERSGADFDQEFIEQMIDMHEADVKLFEKTAEDAKDQELRSFASRHVGHLREHLQQAQSLRQTIMPTGRDSDSTGAMQSTSSTDANATYNSSTTGSTPNGAGSTNVPSTTTGTDATGASTNGTSSDRNNATSSSSSNR